MIDTDSATMRVYHMGPLLLPYVLPTLNASGGLSAPDSRLLLSLDALAYSPAPAADATIWGALASTPRGSPVALFNLESLFLGPPVLLNLTGSRPLVLLSRSAAILDTPLIASPATLGGFAGARNLSQLQGLGANVHGPGSGSKRVQLWTIRAEAANRDEVQQVETSARAGQTLRGFFTLSFKGRVTHPILASAEPDAVRERVEAAFREAGPVRVTRSAITPTGGHVWNITFLSAVGDQPQIEASGRGLTGIGAAVVTRSIVHGNELGGSFALEWAGRQTAQVPVTATAEELRAELESAWGGTPGFGLAHAHVARSNAVARRSDVCVAGACPDPSRPGPAWGLTWLLTLSFQGAASAGGEAAWEAPAGEDRDTVHPLRPVTVVSAPAASASGLGATVTITPGHAALGGAGASGWGAAPASTAPAAARLPPHEFAAEAVFSLAYGGAGASSAGVGGAGHARHGPVSPAPFHLPAEDLLGGSGGAMGGEVPQQPLSTLGPNHTAMLRARGERSCADPPLAWDGVWAPPASSNASDGSNNVTSGCPGAGGAGGGAIAVFAATDLIIGPSGGIVVDAADAEDGWRGGGGGAGGSIILGAGGALTLHGALSARGGNGGRGVGLGSRGGGGGGGGLVAAFGQAINLHGLGSAPPGGGEGPEFNASGGLAAISVAGGAGGLDEEVLAPNATFNVSVSTAEQRRTSRQQALDAARAALERLAVASYNGTGSLGPESLGFGAPLGTEAPARTLLAASGGDGSLHLLSAGGAQYRVDTAPGAGAQGGAEDTQRALLVRVREAALASGGSVAAGASRQRVPYAHNGPTFSLPVGDSGRWWMRRGANATLPQVAARDAGGVAAAALAAYAAGQASLPASLTADYGGLGGSGLDGTPGWNSGARPGRVTVYVRMGKPAYGDATSFWGPHIALHEHDFRNGSEVGEEAERAAMAGSDGSTTEGNAGSSARTPSTGGAGPGGPGGPYGAGLADDGISGGGVGNDASVLVGVGVVEGRWTFGSNYRHSPSLEPAADSPVLSVTRQAEVGRWYKVDVLLNWVNSTYRVRIDDVTVALDQPFNGSAVRRLGLYLFHGGEAWFDEIYAGPDDTMGFECPQSASDGSLRMARPVQSGWVLSDIGQDSFDWNITRHDNHVSQRAIYTHSSRGGLVFGDGAPHRRFHRDIKTVANDGDHNATHGRVLAGALLYVPGDSPPRDLILRSATTAGGMQGNWGAAAGDAARLADSAGGRLGYGGIQSIDAADGFGEVSFQGKTGRFYWYGEHDAVPTAAGQPGGTGRNVSGIIASSQAGNGGLPHPDISRGGVASCSTNDLLLWRNEGIMYRYENISLPEGDRLGPINTTTGELFRLRSERPKTVRNNNTNQFVMWQHVDDTPFRARRAAGVATSFWPNGPFTWEHSLYPDDNETTDLTVFTDPAVGAAFLARTYYETVHYWLPKPVMQPVWESVKKADGTRDFALSYHRAFYHQGYDNPDDIYVQRWRMEDVAWNITVEGWTETWDDVEQMFRLLHADGDVKVYSAADRQAVLDDTFDRYTQRQIHGQGRPPILSRYLDPNITDNNGWSPSSVPAVRAQPWRENYEDKNVADNPPHPSVPDLLIGEEHIAESRRAKHVAISLLNANFTRTTGIVRVFEGEMSNQEDLISIVDTSSRFGWSVSNASARTTYGFDINARALPFNFRTQLDWEDRHWQFSFAHNDRFDDFRNYRDRQTSRECPAIHHNSIFKKDECLFILHNILRYEDAPALNNSRFDLQSYARALNTQVYEDCLSQHRALLDQFQSCTRKAEPIYDLMAPIGVGSRECVGGGGDCGPPVTGVDALPSYGFSPFAPNYTQIYGAASFQRPRELWGPTV